MIVRHAGGRRALRGRLRISVAPVKVLTPLPGHAQASGFLVLALTGFSEMPFLMAVDKARFRSFVGPGVELTVEATLEHQGSGYVATKARIAAFGKPLCDADLRFRTMPFPPGMETPLRDRATAIGLLGEAA